MVFYPNTTQPLTTEPNQTQTSQQAYLPPQPMYQVVQSACEMPQSSTAQHNHQPSFAPPLSSSSTNDEIGELLVAILEEIGALKQAILTETNDDVEQLLKKDEDAVESKQEQTEKPEIDTNQDETKLRTLDFSSCF